MDSGRELTLFLPSALPPKLFSPPRITMNHMHFQDRGSRFSLSLLPQRYAKTQPNRRACAEYSVRRNFKQGYVRRLPDRRRIRTIVLAG
jgi:hypothetical protein